MTKVGSDVGRISSSVPAVRNSAASCGNWRLFFCNMQLYQLSVSKCVFSLSTGQWAASMMNIFMRSCGQYIVSRLSPLGSLSSELHNEFVQFTNGVCTCSSWTNIMFVRNTLHCLAPTET